MQAVRAINEYHIYSYLGRAIPVRSALCVWFCAGDLVARLTSVIMGVSIEVMEQSWLKG